MLDDGHRLLEVAEVAADGLVDQRGAVGEKEDAFLQAAFPEAVDDLEGGVGFAGARGHDEQDGGCCLRSGDGLDSAVDGDLLVIAGGAIRAVGEVVLSDDRRSCRR